MGSILGYPNFGKLPYEVGGGGDVFFFFLDEAVKLGCC